MKKLSTNNNGFTLIETLAAVAIIAVISLAAFIAFGSITNLAAYTSDNQKIINSVVSAMDGGEFNASVMGKNTQAYDFSFALDGEEVLIHTNTVSIYSHENHTFSLTSCNYTASGGNNEPTPEEVLEEMVMIGETVYELMQEADPVWDAVRGDAVQRLLLFNSNNGSPSTDEFRYYILRELGGSWPELPLDSTGGYPNILYYSTPLYIQVTIYNPKNNSENTDIVTYVSDSTTVNSSSLVFNHENGNWYIAKSPYTSVSLNQTWANIRTQIMGSNWKVYIPQ